MRRGKLRVIRISRSAARAKSFSTARFGAVLSRSTHNRKPNRKQRATENEQLIPSRLKQAEVQPYAMLIGDETCRIEEIGKISRAIATPVEEAWTSRDLLLPRGGS